MKRVFALVLMLALAVTVSPAQEQIHGAGEYTERTIIVDSQGVSTVATGFGKLFGPPYLNAHRGDSQVQIPFDLISSLETGAVEDGLMTVDLDLVSGRRMDVIVDSAEYRMTYAGTTEFGYFRIRFQDLRSLRFERTVVQREGPGKRCPHGRVFHHQEWRFCPYCGQKLEAIEVAPVEER